MMPRVQQLIKKQTQHWNPKMVMDPVQDRPLDIIAAKRKAMKKPPKSRAKAPADDIYRISIAVAGFAQEDLDVPFQSSLLTVTGKKQENANDGYLRYGIAGRPFEHRVELAGHVSVNGADLQNGLLSIDRVLEFPEALRPRRKDIQANPALAPLPDFQACSIDQAPLR